jgi:hypothetical protein
MGLFLVSWDFRITTCAINSPPAGAAELTCNRISALRMVVFVALEVVVWIVDRDFRAVENVYDRSNASSCAAAVGAATVSMETPV